MIDDKALIAKADAGEGLTVEEIKCYQQLVKPRHHVYGKYGTLALKYMEEHNVDSRVLIAWTSPQRRLLRALPLILIAIPQRVLRLRLRVNSSQNTLFGGA